MPPSAKNATNIPSFPFSVTTNFFPIDHPSSLGSFPVHFIPAARIFSKCKSDHVNSLSSPLKTLQLLFIALGMTTQSPTWSGSIYLSIILYHAPPLRFSHSNPLSFYGSFHHIPTAYNGLCICSSLS